MGSIKFIYNWQASVLFFFTENFKNTDVYKDYILNQTFNREIKSGALDLSGFTPTSETYTVTDLTFKLTPRNSSDIDIELKYSGKITFKKHSSSDSHYSSFSTAYLDADENEVSSPLTATIQITDTRNGGNSVLTDLFTFDQITISGTGFFKTANPINIALGSDDVELRYDSLDIDYTSTANESIGIDFTALSTDNYTVTKTVNGTLVETSNVNGIDDGDASFSISGTVLEGNTLSISQDAADPDGTGTLSYSWQVSQDLISWYQVGTSSSYLITKSDENKYIRAVISYLDNEGFRRSLTVKINLSK